MSAKASGNEPAKGADNYCHTKRKVINFSFIWSIENFSFCCEENGENLQSPSFSSIEDHETKWCLELYPNGIDEKSSDYVSLYARLESCRENNVSTKLKFAILNSEHEKKVVKECRRVLSECDDYGFHKFIDREFLLHKENGLIQDDKVTFYCEINASTESEYVNTMIQTFPIKIPDCDLSDNFGKILENSEFSDVTLSVDGRELLAHKNILSARSPVFSAMFKHDMAEKENSTVEITDIDHATSTELLFFIYTGKARRLDELGQGLLVAANKYALDRLKVMCEEALRSNLTIDNVCDVLVLADKHNADQLKTHAVDFVIHHAADVVKTNSWKTLELNHSHLVNEAFRAIAEHPHFF